MKILHKINLHCSWIKLYAVLAKEFIQISRDRVTFAMIIGIPLIQLILFGFAINTNPKKMPTVIIANDYSEFTRGFISGLKNSDYFMVKEGMCGEAQAKNLLAKSRTQFIITIPADFTKKMLRRERPQILLEADATDPVATSSAINAVNMMALSVFAPLFHGSLGYLQNYSLDKLSTISTHFNAPFEIITHANYNPEGVTAYNIVPGLLGVVLTMTMVIVTSMGITREREKGTMEHLLATPLRPLEVMLGKLLPYLIVGYIQVFLILIAANYLFGVPFHGSILLLILVTMPFIAANLAVGLTFSSLANNQLQSAQMSIFFFLPSMLLSGFMFPFRGMPMWAQDVGSLLPLTYFLRIVRGIMLKGNGLQEIWPDFWPIVLFLVIAIVIALTRYRKTLD